ncbi:MAG: MFS transporter [SAR324 cluster bacterium]|nr:MFS transporter [SAR324 cluster bacterium]
MFQILPVFLVLFLVFMDHLMMVPLSPTISESIGLSLENSGYLIAVYPLTAACSAFITAPFSDRWGRKKILLVLAGGFFLSTLGCALSFDVFTMFTFRILSGFFGGPIMPNAIAYTGDLFDGEKRAKAITLVMLGFAISSILGVPFGAWIGDFFSWEASFYAVAFAALFCWFGIYRMRPVETGIEHGLIFPQYVELLKLWKFKEIRKLFYTSFFMLAGLFGLVPNLGPWLTINMGMSTTQVGFCYMLGGVGGIIGNQLSPQALKYISKPGVVSLGSIIMGITLLLFTNLSYPVAFSWVFMACLMFGGSFRMPAFQLMLTETVPIYMRGRLMSMSMIVMNLSMGLGGIWSTPLLTLKNGVIHGISIIGIIAFCATLLVVPLIYSTGKLSETTF